MIQHLTGLVCTWTNQSSAFHATVVRLDKVLMILEVILRNSGTRSPPLTPRVYFDSPRRALSGVHLLIQPARTQAEHKKDLRGYASQNLKQHECGA